MNIKLSQKNISIISDFDGTITTKDTNKSLISHFGNVQNQKIEKLYRNNFIGTKEAMKRHFQNMDFKEQEYKKFLLNNILLDPYFELFYKKIKKKNIPFKIVSAGFINTINLLLKNKNINISEIYANKLYFRDNNIDVEFYHNIEDCSMPFEVCGNCKLSHMKNKSNQNIIFIGDGLTDRCMALKADIVFAKDDLKYFCEKERIEHIEYDNFKDIIDYLNI